MGEYNLEISEGKPRSSSNRRLLYIIAGVGILLGVIGLVLIIVGSVKSSDGCSTSGSSSEAGGGGKCGYSEEAQRVGLDKLLSDVKSTYYKMNPNNIAYDPDSSPGDYVEAFSPYNCHPMAIKKRTDAARNLFEKTKALEARARIGDLQPREAKSIEQLKHFLQSNFGAPYDENYYAGDWMLGPNLFCWQPICYVGSDIKAHFSFKSFGFKPSSSEDVDFVISHLKQLNDSLVQYIENLKYGVKAGFVRSVEECQAGLFSFQRKYLKITQQGEIGILNSSSTAAMRDPRWYQSLTESSRQTWSKSHNGKTVEDSIQDSLVTYVGRPLVNLLNYLEFNHSQYCVPGKISSGLATLPLDYIYKNGTNTGEKTTKVLPNGEDLSGKEAYKMILPYFTTNNMTPDEINDLGWEMLNKLYPEAVRIARQITELDNATVAVTAFTRTLENQSMFFNDEPFPANESNKEAFMKCLTMESARMYCPERYRSMLSWFEYVNGVLSILYPKTIDMFYYTGSKRSTPNCPVQVIANFNPATGSQSYSAAGISCSRPCHYRLPFYLLQHGPRYNAYSVAAHEARPGHHTQVQGFKELFSDKCGGVIGWLNGVSYYTAFTEGWALYSENPLINTETDTYKELPLQKYGMLKWQIWRALRLIIDTGLHYKGMSRQKALDLFAKYAWDRTDKATKDVTRYQSDPGQATAYMIGQLAIWRSRNNTEQKLKAANKKFNEKDFHFQVLSQGPSPLSYLESHINKFTSCVVDPSTAGCDDILNPQVSSADTTTAGDEAGYYSNEMTSESMAFYEPGEEEVIAGLDTDWKEGYGKPKNPRFHPENYD